MHRRTGGGDIVWRTKKNNPFIVKVLKCGAGGGRKRSVGLIMREMKKYYLESMSRGISYMK
jgi:hypothetical protein